MMKPDQPAPGLNRRELIRKSVVGAGIMVAAPIVTSIPASAGTVGSVAAGSYRIRYRRSTVAGNGYRQLADGTSLCSNAGYSSATPPPPFLNIGITNGTTANPTFTLIDDTNCTFSVDSRARTNPGTGEVCSTSTTNTGASISFSNVELGTGTKGFVYLVVTCT